MDINAQVISNDDEFSPEFRGLYGARFYADADPENPDNRVIKIQTANTAFNVSSTTNIEGNAICPSPTSFIFEMKYYFSNIWYYSPKYFRIEFCNNANVRLFALSFNVLAGEENVNAKKLAISVMGDTDFDDIVLNSERWYSLRFEFFKYTDDASSRLKIFIGEGNCGIALVRDVAIKTKIDTPTRALLIHSAMKIKGIQYLDDISFTLTENIYSQNTIPCELDEGSKVVYDFEDGIPSERNFFVEMRLKKYDDFLTMDPAVWNAAQKGAQLKHLRTEYTVLLVQTGEAVFVTDEQKTPIYEGSIVIVPPNTKYAIESNHKYNVISISGSFDQLSRFTDSVILHDNIYGEGKKLAELALYNRFGDEEYFASLCNAYLRFILLNLGYPKSDMNAIIYKIMEQMKKNYDNSELSIIKLLRDSGYAKDYVRTKFFEVAKMTPKKYLTSIRMKKAKELLNLCGDDVSIARIAEQCGIVDPAVFSKNFKQFYGISPKQYLQKRKKG